MTPQPLDALARISEVGITTIALMTAVLSILGAFRSGVVGRLRIGSFEIQAPPKDLEPPRGGPPPVEPREGVVIPFETGQLANYYAQVLAQSRISFWFSIVFGSIGFLIIVLAAFMHADSQAGSTIARFIAGVVVDAVAALFFVQSSRAQQSMAEFFDKLRRDRNHVEARKLCENLGTPAARDALRVRLALHYAEVASADSISESIMKTCLGTEKSRVGEAA